MKNNHPIAVVGMSGSFPGAPDVVTYWQNIVDRVETVSEIPAQRWIADPEFMAVSGNVADKAYSTRACLIGEPAFDLSGLGIDPEIVQNLDPLYHLVLHTGRRAFNDCRTAELDLRKVGVALAAIALPTEKSSAVSRKMLHAALEQKLFGGSDSRPRPFNRSHYLASRVTGLPAALLAGALGLGGGTFTLDAACASSLYAVKLACDQLQQGRADAMLAGGVSRPDCLYTQVGFSQLRALSPSGRCAPFDRTADGLVVGEGAGMLVLKRLEDAISQGDRIYGVIRGAGLSNDMRGNLLAPDIEGQLRAMNLAYAAAGWSPREVDLIECHGAGTPVGDAVELASLRKLWADGDWSKGQCAIGSVKSMVGHLLTAAGAAGMIKTLLALEHRILPPSLNFSQPPTDSPLLDSPFRVQTEAQSWTSRDSRQPLRAAVSAFGFGGINAHILLEQWDPPAPRKKTGPAIENRPQKTKTGHRKAPEPVAIVGMEAAFGSWDSLKAFQQGILNGDSTIGPRPPERWKGCDRTALAFLGDAPFPGGYMDTLEVAIDEFQIPPREIPDILPQHLLMLKVAGGALADAGLPLKGERPRVGAAIGMGFDFEETNFHLRWHLINAAAIWNARRGLALNDAQLDQWMAELQDQCSPPLTASRVLGSLGSMIASRVAREFGLGGPCFTLSAEEVSGIRALEIGIQSLRQRETDAFIAGAVDLTGDLRQMATTQAASAWSADGEIRPFDAAGNGRLPGDGAAAVVLKRLKDARTDKDRIYAVISGSGAAGAGSENDPQSRVSAYLRSLQQAFENAALDPGSVKLIETHGSADPLDDQLETDALHRFFSPYSSSTKSPIAVGSVKPNIGHSGAAAGLASVVKASLCLYQEIVPPLPNFSRPADEAWLKGGFHLPRFPHFWVRNRIEGPRRACVCAFTTDGNFAHLILEGHEAEKTGSASPRIADHRRQPLGGFSQGLFALSADSPAGLLKNLDRLARHAGQTSLDMPIDYLARSWHRESKHDPLHPQSLAIVAGDGADLSKKIEIARHLINSGESHGMESSKSVCYSPRPLGTSDGLAFVFPGSGNHYPGMGRELGVRWPEVMRKMDAATDELRSQSVPRLYVPWRSSWEKGWENQVRAAIDADPMAAIFGQVAHGAFMTTLMGHLGVAPTAVIGYSLGETIGLFATGAWPDRGVMLKRMQASDLFKTQLAGPCDAARSAWKIPPEEAVDWRVAAVNRSAREVRSVIGRWPTTRLLIVNTPNECVIGGRGSEVRAAINTLRCKAVYLEAVASVHCDAVQPVETAYRRLHRFPTAAPPGIRYYSSALGRAYEPTTDSAADSITRQALDGFDFTRLIHRAYDDGLRIFLEMGPRGSCSRMIDKILAGKPHLALPAAGHGGDEPHGVLKCMAALIARGVPLNLDMLYGKGQPTATAETKTLPNAFDPIRLSVACSTIRPVLPSSPKQPVSPPLPFSDLAEPFNRNTAAVGEAHQAFIEFSGELTRAYGDAFSLQTRLLEKALGEPGAAVSKTPGSSRETVSQRSAPKKTPAFSRKMCLEFARGSAARVLGPEFSVVDTYPTRVRLPDEPLMLVDRILSVEGERLSLGSGRIVTEHDILPGAWYLDCGRAPVCISVEAGQADLFLCAYLGIDHAVAGARSYRLLDAVVRFHRELPRPGETIRYEINIEKFVRQGETWLFFFNFRGFIGTTPLITMTDGCAGFFTPEEMEASGGIILTEQEKSPDPRPTEYAPPVPLVHESYDDAQVEALRQGDLAACFGPAFAGVDLAGSLRLPGGRMRLVDRVLELDPQGGRYGLGVIRAEADIDPKAWFLTCHFMDDMVMPGTLMYECCAHSLRIFIQRMGWVASDENIRYEPIPGTASRLKCRGPVTPATRHVIYQVEIKQIGYRPQPWVVADAHMFADGRQIVMFKDIGLQMTGIHGQEIDLFWSLRKQPQPPGRPVFEYSRLLEFSQGLPSRAFGPPYRPFDKERFIARLPRPPYLFIDRIVRAEPDPWVLSPDGWATAQCEVKPDAWYFRANRSKIMPFCILLEAALQPCGWLAAYLGSALRSDKDLRFRNLGGQAAIHRDVSCEAGLLTTRVRLTQVSEAAEMIIETFDFEVLQEDQPVYTGNTYFGFFTPQALSLQTGIRSADKKAHAAHGSRRVGDEPIALPPERPLTPAEAAVYTGHSRWSGLAMPSGALKMIDTIEIDEPEGGPHGLGFVRGRKTVDPKEWFFDAHFYQDPVWPGSLGIEAFYQLLKFTAARRWRHLAQSHRFSLVSGTAHQWSYRGQVTPGNKTVTADALVTTVEETGIPGIWADGILSVDNLAIYEMKNFGLQLVPDK